MNPTKFILLCLAGWINREQQVVIEYLQEEIHALKEIHGKRASFNDAQRRRLAAKAKKIMVSSRLLSEGCAQPGRIFSNAIGK